MLGLSLLSIHLMYLALLEFDEDLLSLLTMGLFAQTKNWVKCLLHEHDQDHHEYVQDQLSLPLPFFFEILSVITVAPLGIVCPCGTLRTRSSSALSSYDEQKFI